MTALGALGGFCLASGSAFAVLQHNIWKMSDSNFQLGYVIGYFDAYSLMQKKDYRLQIVSVHGKQYDRWVQDVNAYFANPEHEKDSVPDAIYDIGSKARDKALREWGARQMGKPVPTESATP